MLVKEYGLRPLAVHLDNGWNSDQATRNIYNIVEILDLDLFTYVIDWEEFCDLQRSFFTAGVVDIELLTDHAISTCMMRLAREHKVNWMISGANVTTEGIMPLSWSHSKWDSWNIKSIQRKFGAKRIKTFPLASNTEILRSLFKSNYQRLDILNYVKFDRNIAIKRLTEELKWVPYGEKHYESVFTKFYQAYVLPIRFGADKRLAHLSALIVSGNIRREEAIDRLNKPIYPEEELRNEKTFVLKKLSFEETEFDNLMSMPGIPHDRYTSVHDVAKYFGPFTRKLKKMRYTDVQDTIESGTN